MSQTHAAAPDRLYFRQLLSGRDFAIGDQLAEQMVNFAYAIGDRLTGECVLVDPAYDPAALVDLVGADGLRVTGVLASHYHADHVGGAIFGYEIAGLTQLLGVVDCPVHVQSDEVEWVQRTTGLGVEQLVAHTSGDVVQVGAVSIELVHTPGHTPGSQCFLVHDPTGDKLVSGDTLFLDGCGRTDLPGSDPAQMAASLRRLHLMPDDVVLYPGHRYSPAGFAAMGAVKANNWVFDQL
jgi:hydroxyacylglutathione hydrolase